jgi:peptidoglycan hydrolase CwlO-like protein
VVLAAGNSPTSGQVWVLIGIVITAGGAFITAAYSKSGKIQRTEAEKLWEVNQNEKNEMREDIKNLKAQVEKQDETIVKLREQNFEHRSKLGDVQRENERLKRRIEQLEKQLGEQK